MIVSRQTLLTTLVSVIALVTISHDGGGVNAFVSPSTSSWIGGGGSRSSGGVSNADVTSTWTNAFVPSSTIHNRKQHHQQQKYGRHQKRNTVLFMSELTDESKYTEAAWSAVASATKAADFYQANAVEAPFLLEVMLNPSKHGAGDSAESAKRVVSKVLETAGVNVKEIRSGLEQHLSKQPKITGQTGQKMMGRDLPKVLESAKTIQSVLGVSVKMKGG